MLHGRVHPVQILSWAMHRTFLRRYHSGSQWPCPPGPPAAVPGLLRQQLFGAVDGTSGRGGQGLDEASQRIWPLGRARGLVWVSGTEGEGNENGASWVWGPVCQGHARRRLARWNSESDFIVWELHLQQPLRRTWACILLQLVGSAPLRWPRGGGGALTTALVHEQQTSLI